MADIRLWNTRTRSKVPLEPTVEPGKVSMYVCGPTVYDRAHMGNARPVIVFDVLYRLLRHSYGAENVTYVRNFTDVDDKINRRSQESGRPIADITEETIRWYHEDMGALGVMVPDHEPRATAYIGEMIAMIEGLIGKGFAYEAEGHVLFRVRKYDDYGALSGRSVDDMIAGARVEVAPFKEDPMDFVLWKPSNDDLPGWDSPWGRGRPGWHIECSAMSHALLGPSFDIHGGGNDLMFPHHENEIAQSRCAHPEGDFARIWMHNEMLQVEGKKMSKSLGNFFTVHDVLEQGIPGEVIRFVYLSTHYRKPMDWTAEKAATAKLHLDNWYAAVGDVEAYSDRAAIDWSARKFGLIDALADDLNTSEALSRLFKHADRVRESENLADKREFKTAANVLGFLPCTGTQWVVETGVGFDLVAMLDRVLAALDSARAQKDYDRADYIREALAAGRVQVMSGKGGSSWQIQPFFSNNPDFQSWPDEAVKYGKRCSVAESPIKYLIRLHDEVVER